MHGPDELWLQHNHNEDITKVCIPNPNINDKINPIPTKVCNSNSKLHRQKHNRKGQPVNNRQSSSQLSSSSWRLQQSLSLSTATSFASTQHFLSVPSYLLVVTFITVSLIISSCSANTLPAEKETLTKYSRHSSASKTNTIVENKQQEDGDDVGKEVAVDEEEQRWQGNNHSYHHQGRNYYLHSRGSSSSGRLSNINKEREAEDHGSLSSPFPFPTYYAAYITNAVESGVREANNLYDTVEPDLYKRGNLRQTRQE